MAGFYKAFGVKVSAATERPDHITAELEFVQFLAVKEALATEEEGEDSEEATVCRDASGLFLRDHLSLWMPSFAECLAKPEVAAPYRLAAPLLAGFVACDTAAMGAKAPVPHS